MKYYLYTDLSRVSTMMEDGSEGPVATQITIHKGPTESVPEVDDGLIRVVGTIDDIRRKVEAYGNDRLIIKYPSGDDTALVNLFPDKDTLVVLRESTGDFHAIQKAHVTVAILIRNGKFKTDYDLRDRDFIVSSESDTGPLVHWVLKERYDRRIWDRTDIIGWGQP